MVSSMQEDSDSDGYISCLQVLLALKNIVPPEVLSEEEKISIYRGDRWCRRPEALCRDCWPGTENSHSAQLYVMDFHSLEVSLFRVKV
ncbi:hypothetical protein LDENG_00178670 [Lucifuga dentata]|nr:hypothetical protein LDENG_00178670 [Lucifuga dentata]